MDHVPAFLGALLRHDCVCAVPVHSLFVLGYETVVCRMFSWLCNLNRMVYISSLIALLDDACEGRTLNS